MAEKKITRKEMFAHIAEVCAEDQDIVAFCEAQIAALDRQNEKARERRAQNKGSNPEVEKFRQDVVNYLFEVGEPKTNKEISEHFGVSSQKTANALRVLVERSLVERHENSEKKSAPANFTVVMTA